MAELLVTIAVIAVLVAREITALGRTDQARRRTRALTLVAVPLLAAFLAISVNRLLLTPPPAPAQGSGYDGTPDSAGDQWSAASPHGRTRPAPPS